MDKLWYIQTMGYYFMLKTKVLMNYENTWKSFKCILLSERSQSEKATYCIIPTIWHSRKCKTKKMMKRSVLAGGWGGWDKLAERRGHYGTVKIFCM